MFWIAFIDDLETDEEPPSILVNGNGQTVLYGQRCEVKSTGMETISIRSTVYVVLGDIMTSSIANIIHGRVWQSNW